MLLNRDEFLNNCTNVKNNIYVLKNISSKDSFLVNLCIMRAVCAKNYSLVINIILEYKNIVNKKTYDFCFIVLLIDLKIEEKDAYQLPYDETDIMSIIAFENGEINIHARDFLFMIAIDWKRPDLLKYFLENEETNYLLSLTIFLVKDNLNTDLNIFKNNTDKIKELKSTDLDYAIFLMLTFHYLSGIDKLCSLRKDINKDLFFKDTNELSPLSLAIMLEDWNIVNLFINKYKAGINSLLNSSEGTKAVFFIACRNALTDVINKLLTSYYNNDISNLFDINFNTPFQIAVLHNQYKILPLLAEAKVDLNHKNILGNTALHLSCMYDYLDSFNILIEFKNINLNIKDNDGNTLLHLCTKNYNSYFIIKLIKKDCEINAINKNGDTALHLSIKNKEDETASKIVENAPSLIDSTIKNKEGYDIFELAKLMKNIKIMSIINRLNPENKNNID